MILLPRSGNMMMALKLPLLMKCLKNPENRERSVRTLSPLSFFLFGIFIYFKYYFIATGAVNSVARTERWSGMRR